jgi:hypothetical protein
MVAITLAHTLGPPITPTGTPRTARLLMVEIAETDP